MKAVLSLLLLLSLVVLVVLAMNIRLLHEQNATLVDEKRELSLQVAKLAAERVMDRMKAEACAAGKLH